MLKNIVSIAGVKTLEKQAQKSIIGGRQGDPITFPDKIIPCYCEGVLKAMVDDPLECAWICSFY